MRANSTVCIIITLSSALISLHGCGLELQKEIAPPPQDTSSLKGGTAYETLIFRTPLGSITEEERQKAKENVKSLYEKLRNESKETQKRIIKLELRVAQTNHYELLPIPYRDRVSQTGKGVSIAVIDSGILAETAQHLGGKFIGYHEMAGDYSIAERVRPQLYFFKLFTLIDSHVIEFMSKHGDDMVRFINRIAPDANIMCINNYNREYQVRLGGSRFSKKIYDAPLGITRSIEYILDEAELPKPLIINISEGVSHFRRNLSKKSISDLKQAFEKAYDQGTIIVISAGNMTNKPEDSYRLGLNPGLNCPWVIPAGSVDPKNNARKTRYDPTNRFRVLYVLSRSSSVAAAKVSGLIALLLEKNPSLTPQQIRNILFETADYHEEENKRRVYIINVDRAINRIE